MKIITASVALGLLLGTVALAQEITRKTPAVPKKVPTPGQQEEANPSKPPVLTLDAGKRDPSTGLYNAVPLRPAPPQAAGSLPDPANPGQPALPPHLLVTPATPDGGQTVPLTTKSSEPLAPGIYLASPYTGIVVVPGPIDTPMVRHPGPTPGVMPAPEPELKLTPKRK